MAKLESIEHKIFASEAPLDEIGQFGSALDTTKLNTKDVTTIQALPAYTKGWGSAIISDNNYPTMEEMNGVLNVMSYHTGYLYQEGMPAWRNDREYSATSIVKEPTGTKFFHSLKDGNIGNTLDNTEYWEELKFGGSGLELCDTDIVMRNDKKIFEQLKAMKHSTFDVSKFTVVGSLTITDDGVASGFSIDGLNYIKILNNVFSKIGAKPWKIEFSGKLPSITSGYAPYVLGFDYTNINSFLNLGRFNNGNNLFFNLVVNVDGTPTKTSNVYINTPNTEYNKLYDYFIEYTGEKYTFGIKPRENALYSTKDIEMAYPIMPQSNDLRIGSRMTTGNIDLKQFSITVDGKEVFNGNKTGLDVIKLDNYEVIGSPVISEDGIFIKKTTDADASNYIKFDFNNSATNWKIYFNFIYSGGSAKFIGSSIDALQIYVSNWGVSATIYNATLGNVTISPPVNSSTAIKIGCEYIGYLQFKNGVYELGYLQTNNYDTWHTNSIESDILPDKNILTILRQTDKNTGFSIDLNSFKIYVDGNLIYQPCLKIPYTESKTGSKIVDVAYRDRVIDLYEQQGQAGYYTIDETNKNITLPMGEIYGMIESKADKDMLNNPYSLFDSKYSDHELNNLSWLKSSGQWNDGNVYVDAYNELLTEYNNSGSVEETEGSITFKRTPKGYKIALAAQDTAIEQKYSTYGVAWYYILDTANTRFKLPRTKFGFEGLRGKAGDDIAESLPNITGKLGGNAANGVYGLPYLTGAFKNIVRTYDNIGLPSGSACVSSFEFDASCSSSAYQDGAPVQERATQMYLYFYVGETVQNANLIDAGRIGEQLAGKADITQLANKADLTTPSIQAPYLKTTYINGTSWYRVWSDGWCEQGGYSNAFEGDTRYGNVSFLKAFPDTNYTVVVTGISPIMNNDHTSWVYAKYDSGFRFCNAHGGVAVNWYACGKLKGD